MNHIYMLGLITNRGMRERFLHFFREYHIEVTFAALGRGTAGSALLDYLGMEDTEKAVYFAVITRDTWQELKKALYARMRIDIPGRGIAFLIPLSSVGGKKVLQYLTVGQKIEIEEESTLQNTEYELLVAIANSGYTEVIMDAARSAHAPGGTVLHAKGTGAEHAERFLGISLAEEKEMVFIVVKAARKNAIMRAIMEQAGTDSKAGTVVFSLPVTETAGLRMMEEMDED
ncbi:MAG TPA: P-II family nitrogen regulator [Candidatus Dorea merdavium]|uniref:P-II family nitrogen regulator n=1 Tax=Massilistercora timonensis TaxID=2086584 RepID=UPI000D10C3EC|nr:P-II family nitrogen regulator [Massilistercora timonensis]HIY55041.1 P-II family nitrogen regulator [Candidatus Dorea merdavium]